MAPEFPHLRRFLTFRIGVLRSLRRFLVSKGIGLVVLNGSEEDFWKAASMHIPVFTGPLQVGELDDVMGNWRPWTELRAQVASEDRIYPFAMNVDTMATRLGYVVLRRGKPIGGAVRVSS